MLICDALSCDKAVALTNDRAWSVPISKVTAVMECFGTISSFPVSCGSFGFGKAQTGLLGHVVFKRGGTGA
jgi:hypothetical protein